MTRTERRAYWLRHVRKWQESGLPGSVYCASHGLNRKSFYRWRKVAAASRNLVPVELVEPEGSVRIWVGDLAVEVDARSSPEAVRIALRGLSS